MSSLTCSLCQRSLLGKNLRQEAFMRSILEPFIEYGPQYVGDFIDHLVASGVLQTKHWDILTVSDTGKQARKLWTLLLRLPPRTFEEHVEPLLVKEEYGFLFMQQPVTFREAMCLRCFLEHFVPVEELADKMVRQGCLRQAEYRDTAVNSGIFIGDKWEIIRQCWRRDHDKPEVVDILKEILEEFEIPVPQQLESILAQGIPCACDTHANKKTEMSGPLCRNCKNLVQNGTTRCRSVCVRNNYGFERFVRSERDDVLDDVDIRHSSCRYKRLLQMTKVASIQKEFLNSSKSRRGSVNK